MDARNFLFSSDYPMPAICLEYNGHFSAAANEVKTVTVPHNLPFKPLLIGQWSNLESFAPSLDINTTLYLPTYDPMQGRAVSSFVGSDATNIKIDIQNFWPATVQFYYRLWAYAPPDYDGDVPNVYDNTNFQLSTDFNYPKIVEQGTLTLGYKAEGTIHHGLGYIPQVRVWEEVNGVIQPCQSFWESVGGKGGPRITSQDLIIRNFVNGVESGDTRKYYYHIYGDEI